MAGGMCGREDWRSCVVGVCGRGHSFQGACVARGMCVAGDMHGRGGMHGGGMHGRGCAWQRGACMAGEMAIAAGSMHPTGIHYFCYHFS